MCIRDRIWQVTPDALVVPLDFEPEPAFFNQVDTLLAGLKSVSYTHLQAHETVLDLVCRLLLEKKHESITTTVQL